MFPFNKFPYSNMHGLNLAWIVNTINNLIDTVAGLGEELGGLESSDDITNSRKLSETGDFTGTLDGIPISDYIPSDLQVKGLWVNVLAGGNVKGDYDLTTGLGTDDTVALQAIIDSYGVEGIEGIEYEDVNIFVPYGFYLVTDTIWCQYPNINLIMEGSFVSEFDGATIDFDYANRRRNGVVGDGGAWAWRRSHQLKVIRKDTQWNTVNTSPAKYDRMVLTFDSIPSDGDSLVLNGVDFIYKNAPSLDTDIQIGGSISETIANTVSVIESETFTDTTTTATSVTIEHGLSPINSYKVSTAITQTGFEVRDVGVRFGNIWDSSIKILRADNFTIGYEFIASAKDTSIGGFGMETCRVEQGRIFNSQIGGRISQENGAYCHDFTIEGGNWRVDSVAGVGTSHYGFVIDNVRASNNIFNHVDHEPTTPTDSNVQETPSFLFMGNVWKNRVYGTRGERATVLARLEQGAEDIGTGVLDDQGPYYNVFYTGYENLDIVDNTRVKMNEVNRTKNGHFSETFEIASKWNVPLLDVNNLYDNVLLVGATQEVQVGDFSFIKTADSDETVYNRTGGASISTVDGTVRWSSSYALVQGVNGLAGDEEFLLTAKSPTGKSGRPFVRAFDSSGVQVTSGVLGSIGVVSDRERIEYSASTNGFRTFGNDHVEMRQRIKLDNPDIDHIYIGVIGGTNNAELSTMQLYMAKDSANVRTGVVGRVRVPMMFSNSRTMSGTYRQKGTIVWAETATYNGTKLLLGWRYRDDGSAWDELWVDTV